MYADFQENIFAEISGKKFQTFHCSNVTAMKSLEFFPRNLREDFFLKIGIHSAKVYTKKAYNIGECNFILWGAPEPPLPSENVKFLRKNLRGDFWKKCLNFLLK